MKQPSRGLDDPFPSPDDRELTTSTSIGSNCPRVYVSLGFKSRILKPNFASTYVTISRRASSNVHTRFELRITCFSSSSGTNTSAPAKLISSSNLSFNLFLTARNVRFPSFDPCLQFQKRAPSRRNDRSQQVSFPSTSSDHIVSAVFAMPRGCSSASWRQCHLPHNS